MTDLHTQPSHDYQDDEISLLDILVTLAESWKLLVFGPLAVGVLAGALSFLVPNTYESVAIVRMSEEEAALLHAAPVLDPLIEKFGYVQEANGNKDEARKELKKDITFVADKKTKLLSITAKAHTPESAQALGNAAITALLAELVPKGKDKDLLLQTIALNKQSIADNTEAVDSIKKNMGKVLSAGNNLAMDTAVKQFANFNADISRLTLDNISMVQKMAPRGPELYVQAPSLVELKSAPKRGLVVLIAVLASGFALMLWVFVRKAWAGAMQDPESAVKVAAIKQSLDYKKLFKKSRA